VSQLRFVFLGLSITSSWGNGHATTYRGLVRELVRRGHDVLFLERDVPYYADNRDLPLPPYGRTALYGSLEELKDRYGEELAAADVAIVGSYVPDGIQVGDWVCKTSRGLTAFYDIDTPITLRALRAEGTSYLEARQIPAYDLYLSFTGGPLLKRLKEEFGAQVVRPLYCSADEQTYFPEPRPESWDLGYLGTYSQDRQPALEMLLIDVAHSWPAGRFVVTGPQYPEALQWPRNVERCQHLAPPAHRAFYTAQRFTLNLTRQDMLRAGYSPSVRLFEAAACGTPIISDVWPGVERFFEPEREVLLARNTSDVVSALRELSDEARQAIGQRGRRRVLSEHTAAHRAETLERYVMELSNANARVPRRTQPIRLPDQARGQS
jgi:spore maturation protein CgeB